MAQETWDRIRGNPKFQAFVRKRNTYSIIMTVLGALAYYGFILLVAYDKAFLATKIGGGVTTIGIPLGVGVIVFTILLTWIYVGRANREFDAESEAIVKEATR
ncbi:MAG: DUF485 domain-containing protein [Rhodocyclaceae bacterium]|nr:DUF485 domain-containing protein [Rhodocyclaceae bacterium]